MRWLSRFLAVAHKEVWHMVRDPRVLYMALGMPVVLIILYGNAVSFDLEHIRIVVADKDRSQQSRSLVDRFGRSDAFEVIGNVDAKHAVRVFRRGSAKGVLVIPRGFAKDVVRGDRPEVQFLLDGSDNTTASQALGYAQVVAFRYLEDSIEALGAGMGQSGIEARTRVLFNPRLESSHYLVPGLMVVIMTLLAVILTALTVAREWEEGSMEMLLTTQAGQTEILLGKLSPYFVLGMVQVLLVIASGAWLFDVPVRGSLWLLSAASVLFLLGLLAQGLVISVVTKNQMLATLVAAMSTMLPSLILSDFIFPVANMPAWLRYPALVLPPLHFVRALRAILIRGAGISVVGQELAAMAGFFLFVLGVAVVRFRGRLD